MHTVNDTVHSHVELGRIERFSEAVVNVGYHTFSLPENQKFWWRNVKQGQIC